MHLGVETGREVQGTMTYPVFTFLTTDPKTLTGKNRLQNTPCPLQYSGRSYTYGDRRYDRCTTYPKEKVLKQHCVQVSVLY